MASKSLNSVNGFSVGVTPVEVIYANGDANVGNLTASGNATAVNIIATSNVETPNLNVSTFSNLGDLANVVIYGGDPGYVIQTDGTGTLSWAPQTPGTTAAGSNTQIQFNDEGAFGAVTNFTFNKTSNVMLVPNVTVTGSVTSGNYLSGNSNITIASNGNINMAVRGVANVLRLSNTGFYSNSDIFNISARIEQMGGNPNTAPLQSNDGLDRGIILNYYDTFQKQAFIGWDLSNAEIIIASETTSTTPGIIDVVNYANVRADYFLGNFQGNVSGNILSPGSNTQVLFNDDNQINAAAGMTFNKTTNTLSVANAITATGNINAGNVNVGATITVQGNARVGNITSLGEITAIGNISGLDYSGSGNMQVIGNASFGNIDSGGDATVLGNLSTGNASVNQNLIVLQDSDFYGNYVDIHSVLDFRVAAANANFDNRVLVGGLVNGSFIYPNGHITIGSLNVDKRAIGATTGRVAIGGNLTVSGNATFASGITATGISNLGNLIISGNANIGQNLLVNANANILGNLVVGNADLGNLATANFVAGDGYLLTNLTIAAGSAIVNGNSNVQVEPNANVTISSNGVANVVQVSESSAQFNANVIVPGNINVGNVYSSNVVQANTIMPNTNSNGLQFSGYNTISALHNASITHIAGESPGGYLNISVSGTGGLDYIALNAGGGVTASGALTAASLSSVGNINTTGNISASGNLTIANVSAVRGNFTGNVVALNVDGGNLVKANFIQGDGRFLSNVTALAGTSLENGNSNVIVWPNAETTISSNGVANVFTVDQDGTVVVGTSNTTNLQVTTDAFVGNLLTANKIYLETSLNGNGSINSNGAVNILNSISGYNLIANKDIFGYSGGLIAEGNAAIYGFLDVSQHANFTSLKTESTLTVNNIAYFNRPVTYTGYATLSVSNTANFSSNVTITANANITQNVEIGGNLTVAGTSNLDEIYGSNIYITTNISVTGDSFLGNVATANYFSGDGRYLTNVTAVAGTSLVNGTSNLYVDVDGPVRVGIAGAANRFIINSVGTTSLGLFSVTGNANVGNIGAARGVFTSNISASNANFSGNLKVSGSANIVGNIEVGNANLGNYAYANFFEGDGGLLTNIQITAGSAIENGGSNVFVQYSGNILFKSNSVANIVVVTDTGLTTTGDITASTYSNGNSNISIVANSDINFSSDGNANILVVTGTGANVYGVFRTVGNATISGNANVNNLGLTGIVIAGGNITGGNLNTGGTVSATGNVRGGNLSTTGRLIVGGNASVTGNINGANGIFSYGIYAQGANIDAGLHYVSNVADPLNPQDAATKNYVDTTAQGLHVHTSCYVGTTTTLAVASGGTISYDNGLSGVGATLTTTGTFHFIDGGNVQTVGTRILVKNETTQAWNGIYTYTSTTVLTRATDADVDADFAGGDFVFVNSGNTLADTGWVQTTDNVVIGTSPIVWSQFSGAGTYQAGTGLTLDGTVFNVNNSQTQITAVGTLTSLSVSGNIVAANLSGANLISGNYLQGTLITNAQPNITSTGILTSLSVSGNANIGNIGTAGEIIAIGNITGDNLNIGNVIATGIISSTGNVTGGNLVTVGLANVGSLSVSGTSNLGPVGNVTITGGIANYYLKTDGSGLLSWDPLPQLIVTNDDFVGDGTTTTYTLTVTPVSEDYTFVSCAGLFQPRTTYSLSGNVITFSSPPAASAPIEVTTLSAAAVSLGSVTNISNGSSNVSIYSAGGNIAASVNGNSNVVVISGTGANVTGTLSVSGNIQGANLIGSNVFVNTLGSGQIAIGFTSGQLVGGPDLLWNFSNAELYSTGYVSNRYVSATGNITGGNLITGGQVSASGNVTGQYILGNGFYLSGLSTSSISNGTSNVNVINNGNVNISSAGNANVLTITGTGANITGTLSVSGKSNLGPASNVIITGGTATYVLSTDGAGNLTWAAPAGMPYASASANFSASANTSYIVDTSTSSITITLPGSPVFGQQIGIIDGTGNASTNPITVYGNGSNIQGLNSNMTVNTNRSAFTIVYYNTAQGWLLTNV